MRLKNAGRCKKTLLYILLAILLFTAGIPSSSAQESEGASVLVLSSYHRGDPWTDQVTGGIEAVLEEQAPDTRLYFEYMDSNRIGERGYYQKLYELYRLKFRGLRFDAVVCIDEDAFNFMLTHHKDLFPSAPVIFCGVNYLDNTMLVNQTAFTGVVEEVDIRNTVATALEIYPSTKQIVVVNDRTLTGVANNKRMMEVVPEYQDRVDFLLLDNLTMHALERELERLPDDRIVLFMGFSRDASGEVFDMDTSISRISQASTVPVFGLWDVYAGDGIIGGMLTNGTEQGRLAGEMVTRILNGEGVTSIPIARESTAQYLFDYVQMKRFHLNVNDLPTGSSVINLPDPFYSIPKVLVWGVSIGSVGLIAVVIILALNISRRRAAEAKLRESEEKFRGIAQRSFEMIYIADANGRITYASPAVERVLGFSQDEVIGRPLHQFATEADTPRMKKMLLRAAEGEPIDEFEVMVRRRDGTPAVIEFNISPISNNGTVVSIQGEARDITAKKQIEELKLKAFEQIEKNIEQFASLGDQIRNPLSVIVGLADLHGGEVSKKILTQAWEIDEIIDRLDQGWIESEKVREFLSRQYGKKDNNNEN
jgi:PAS domain S-box-containing protein